MAVGDDAQSIYAFRGATVENILDFPALFPGTALIKLEENYRSTQPILTLTNAVLQNAGRKFEKHLFSSREDGPLPDLMAADVVKGVSGVRRLTYRGLDSLAAYAPTKPGEALLQISPVEAVLAEDRAVVREVGASVRRIYLVGSILVGLVMTWKSSSAPSRESGT